MIKSICKSVTTITRLFLFDCLASHSIIRCHFCYSRDRSKDKLLYLVEETIAKRSACGDHQHTCVGCKSLLPRDLVSSVRRTVDRKTESVWYCVECLALRAKASNNQFNRVALIAAAASILQHSIVPFVECFRPHAIKIGVSIGGEERKKAYRSP